MLLSDRAIAAELDGSPIIRYSDGHAPDRGLNGPFQPSSFDLSIDKVLIPGVKGAKSGSASNAKTSHTLMPGSTAVVVTMEIFDLPARLGGIVFSMNKVSREGILLTNPGHVDPGYKGTLKFTIINMGQDEYELARGNKIASLMLLEVKNPTGTGWSDRHKSDLNQDSAIQEINRTNELLEKLSVDFLDIKSRATKIARKEVLKNSFLFSVVLVAVTILLTLLGSWFAIYINDHSQVSGLSNDVTQLQREVSRLQLDTTVGNFRLNGFLLNGVTTGRN